MHLIALVIINDKTIHHDEIYTTIDLIRSYQYESNCLSVDDLVICIFETLNL